jgi:molybdopterin-containing oxidoreductase family membrane subunit
MTARLSGHALVADPRAVLRAIRQEAISTPRPLRAWFGLLGLLMLFGAVGAIRSLIPGDKGIGTTPTFEWGLLIVGYVFFAVTTSGLCLASSLGTVFGIDRFRPLEKRHALLAVLCLVAAFGVIALDLHYPVRLAFGAAFNPSLSSPMWWMGVFYGIYLCFLLTEVWSIFWHHERIHSMACFLSSAMAIIAPTTLGAVFGVLAARPYWTGAFTPMLMVASALLSGTALLAIVFCAVARLRLTGFERASALAIPAIRSVLILALVVAAVLLARQLIVGLLATDPGLSAATQALISGPLAVQFVGVRVIAGLLLPLVILVVPRTRGADGVFWAGCLVIAGVFADRLVFVSAGQIAPTTATSGVVSAPYATYTPSPVEISILVGAAAFVALLYTLAERYLDLSESEVHVGLSLPPRLSGWWRGHSGGQTVAVAANDAGAEIELAQARSQPALVEPERRPTELEAAGLARPEAGWIEPADDASQLVVDEADGEAPSTDPEPEPAAPTEPEPEPAPAAPTELEPEPDPRSEPEPEPEAVAVAETVVPPAAPPSGDPTPQGDVP